MKKLTKKQLAEIERRYKVPKNADPETARKARRNKTAAIWRASNPEKVRESSRKYREKAKEVEILGRKIIDVADQGGGKIEQPDEKPTVTVTPITKGPELFFSALSYGSEADKMIIASYREAQFSGRQTIGLIEDFDGNVRGPYFTEQAFTAAIKDLYQDATELQKKAGFTYVKSADGKKTRKSNNYPIIIASSSDDGSRVIVTVKAVFDEQNPFTGK